MCPDATSLLDSKRSAYDRFWRGEKLGRPLLWLTTRRERPFQHPLPPPPPANPVDRYLNPDYVLAVGRRRIAETEYLGDSYPYVNTDMGPGSLAAYLGAGVEFTEETVWFFPCLGDISDPPPRIDEGNEWWRRHLAVVRAVAEAGRREGFVAPIPDLIEGTDTLASLRGQENMILDMMTSQALVRKHLETLDDRHIWHYDRIHEAARDAAGWSAATYLLVWGPGRARKLQCDSAAFLNPDLFREFALPSLTRQAASANHVAYHLDGPEAVYSAEMVASIPNLRVIQWVPGVGQPPTWHEMWDASVYDLIVAAGKVIQVPLYSSMPPPGKSEEEKISDMVMGCDRLVKRYGPDALWLVFPERMPDRIGRKILEHASAYWATAQ